MFLGPALKREPMTALQNAPLARLPLHGCPAPALGYLLVQSCEVLMPMHTRCRAAQWHWAYSCASLSSHVFQATLL